MEPARIVTHVSSTVRRAGISQAKVRRLVEATLAAERIRNAMISVVFIGRGAMARMNSKYLRHRGATDVISFGMGRGATGMPAVGDIYICTDVARKNARQNSIPLSEELARLVIHGTLHVAGRDHPDDESRTQSAMWRKQEQILASTH
jgi:probable rRNA maturation factor